MVWSNLHTDSVLAFSVILFQVIGVAALCMSRLLPPTSSRWAERGRTGFVIAMIGLGLAGALCGRHDSEFSLFAGGSMTILLIGMICGSGQAEPTRSPLGRSNAGPNLAG